MATESAVFGAWVTAKREERKWSQAQLAREVTRHIGSDFTRDVLWKLEHGQPETPRPQVVSAVAKALGRPLTEALVALGYAMPPTGAPEMDDDLVEAVRPLSFQTQKRLASVIPAILGVAAVMQEDPALRQSPLGVTSTVPDNVAISPASERPNSPWRKAAKERANDTAGTAGAARA